MSRSQEDRFFGRRRKFDEPFEGGRAKEVSDFPSRCRLVAGRQEAKESCIGVEQAAREVDLCHGHGCDPSQRVDDRGRFAHDSETIRFASLTASRAFTALASAPRILTSGSNWLIATPPSITPGQPSPSRFRSAVITSRAAVK